MSMMCVSRFSYVSSSRLHMLQMLLFPLGVRMCASKTWESQTSRSLVRTLQLESSHPYVWVILIPGRMDSADGKELMW